MPRRRLQQGLKRWRRFFGWRKRLPKVKKRLLPSGIIPGRGPHVTINLGKSPAIVLARGRRLQKVALRGYTLQTDHSGRKLFLISPRSRGGRSRFRYVGRAVATKYIVPKGKGFKARSSTVEYTHKHEDEGGEWGKAYRDQFGNYKIESRTVSVNKWIRR